MLTATGICFSGICGRGCGCTVSWRSRAQPICLWQCKLFWLILSLFRTQTCISLNILLQPDIHCNQTCISLNQTSSSKASCLMLSDSYGYAILKQGLVAGWKTGQEMPFLFDTVWIILFVLTHLRYCLFVKFQAYK